EAAFTLTAAPAPMANLTVSLSVAEAAGSDFVASGDEGMKKTVTIPTSGSATYTVATEDDSTDEPNGSVTATVADGSGYTVGTPSEATIIVNDNDEAPLGALEEAEEAVIFPNPSGDYLEVRSPIEGTFQLLSLSGKPLLEGTTNTRTDITSLRSGLYLVQMPDGRLLKLVRE
ncbi:MAG: T9SS type A sorting domain-containing protein, partial [Ekhidna sp.]|nr:T9SS type A sorting domain-containing protein [Ekhidna sp.]